MQPQVTLPTHSNTLSAIDFNQLADVPAWKRKIVYLTPSGELDWTFFIPRFLR